MAATDSTGTKKQTQRHGEETRTLISADTSPAPPEQDVAVRNVSVDSPGGHEREAGNDGGPPQGGHTHRTNQIPWKAATSSTFPNVPCVFPQ